MITKTKPEILDVRSVAQSRIFTVEQVTLRFANGQEAQFERMRGNEAVMVLPITQQNKAVLVREYAAGTDSYEIGLLKGKIDAGETPAQAAMREMQEEVGFASSKMEFVRTFVNAPQYSGAKMHLFFAFDLYESPLPGDEIEPLEVIQYSEKEIASLYSHAEVNDARTLFALHLYFSQTKQSN